MSIVQDEETIVKENMKYTYTIKKGDFINKAFKSIPSNSIIDKGKCGIGGTTMEIEENRSSIIIVPNISIIKAKTKDHKVLFGFYGEISNAELEVYLKSKLEDKGDIKIMVTPEGLARIIEVSFKCGLDIYEKCFLLFDEVHSVITEGEYRKDISEAFQYFFKFNDKAVISATPLSFTDPRFKTMDYHEIKVDEEKGKVHLLYTSNVIKSASKFLIDKSGISKRFHIFLNSVYLINEVVNLLPNKDIAICCAENKDNKIKLGNNAEYMVDPVEDEKFRKYNFYTTKYFEGWDLFDDDCSVVYVSSTDIKHTCLDIDTKVRQAFGRLRENQPKFKIHISDFLGKEENVDIHKVYNDTLEDRIKDIEYYNDGIRRERFGLISNLKDEIEEIADFTDQGYAELNYFKQDAFINAEKAKLQYRSLDSLEEAWKRNEYDIKMYKYDSVFSEKDLKILENNRTSRNEKLKIVVSKIHEYEVKKRKGVISFDREEDIESYKKEFAEFNEFYSLLRYEKIAEMDFNYINVKKEYYREYQFKNFDNKIRKYLSDKFDFGEFYTNEEIRKKLKEAYRKVGLEKEAMPRDISKYFNCMPFRKSVGGIDKRGYRIN